MHKKEAQNKRKEIEKLNKEINAGLADPKIKARLADDGDYGKVVVARLRREIQSVKSSSRELAELGDAPVTPELLEKHWKASEGRNISWGVTSMFADASRWKPRSAPVSASSAAP